MRSVPPSEQAVISTGAGCLSGFLFVPLGVVILGCLLALLALNTSLVDPLPSVQAAPLPEQGLSAPLTASGGIAALFTAEVQVWSGHIQRWASTAGVDPNLAATVMQIESCGDPLARSRSGAMGLFQVMPFHFTADDDPYDPETNALRGLAYLRRSYETASGQASLAFAGYNGGIGVIGLGQSSWAAETIRYEYWASAIYHDAASGASGSPRLQEWLDAGGASLCRQAHTRLGLP